MRNDVEENVRHIAAKNQTQALVAALAVHEARVIVRRFKVTSNPLDDALSDLEIALYKQADRLAPGKAKK